MVFVYYIDALTIFWYFDRSDICSSFHFPLIFSLPFFLFFRLYLVHNFQNVVYICVYRRLTISTKKSFSLHQTNGDRSCLSSISIVYPNKMNAFCSMLSEFATLCDNFQHIKMIIFFSWCWWVLLNRMKTIRLLVMCRSNATVDSFVLCSNEIILIAEN